MHAFHAPRAARRLAGSGALTLAVLATAAVPALAGATATHAQRRTTLVLRFYSVTTSFTYTTAAGKVLAQPPDHPAAGDRLELTDVDYKGSHAHHAKRWTASDHTLCSFGAGGGAPTCDGQAAIGGNQLLLFHTAGGGQGGPTVVSGGTGRYAGATGTVDMTEISGTNDSDVVVTVQLAK
ncbi:MAG TPA: hypothetical protein VGK92_04685 [Gaiellales bacterium]|jgi:hypothetical protein